MKAFRGSMDVIHVARGVVGVGWVGSGLVVVCGHSGHGAARERQRACGPVLQNIPDAAECPNKNTGRPSPPFVAFTNHTTARHTTHRHQATATERS